MSTIWTGGLLTGGVLTGSFDPVTDPDTLAYVQAVETADGQALEPGMDYVYNDFITGLKLDGHWDKIGACCILAGARTLAGALVPLRGPAPTNNSFVAADYSRTLGMDGNGTVPKYLDTNYNSTDDPEDDVHCCIYTPTPQSSIANNEVLFGYDIGFGSAVDVTRRTQYWDHGCRTTAATSTQNPEKEGLVGVSRSLPTSYQFRAGQTTITRVANSQTTTQTIPYYIFASYHTSYNPPISSTRYSHRISFYSVGGSVDLEQMEFRVNRLLGLIAYLQVSGLPSIYTMDLDAAAYIGNGYTAGGSLS